MKELKIALNKTYLTNKGKEFSPIRTRRGNEITERDYFNKNRIRPIGYYEIIFIDKDGLEFMKSDLLIEIKK